MREDERTPLVAGGEARASKQAGGLNLGKTAWSFCMGLIIVALAVLGAVLAVVSARGGLARHQEARFVRDGVNESGAALASMDHDYDYAHDVGRFEEPALGDAKPPALDPVLVDEQSPHASRRSMSATRRAAHRGARREPRESGAGAEGDGGEASLGGGGRWRRPSRRKIERGGAERRSSPRARHVRARRPAPGGDRRGRHGRELAVGRRRERIG